MNTHVELPKLAAESLVNDKACAGVTISKEIKTDIAKQVSDLIHAQFGYVEKGKREHSVSLYWTLAAQRALAVRGIHSQVQAGNMTWPVMDRGNRHGSPKPTHMAFTFDASDKKALVEGRLPEMHVWLYIPGTKELVDFSTGEIKSVASHVAPILEWDVDQADPPPYLWRVVDKKHDFYDYGYAPSTTASFMVEVLSQRLYAYGCLDWLVEGIKKPE